MKLDTTAKLVSVEGDQVFTVVVRSMGRVSPDTIKNLIQQRHEVVKIEETDSTLYVHAPVVRDFP